MTALSGRQTIGVCTAIAVAVWSGAPAWAAPAAAPQTIQLSIGGGAVDSAAFRWSSALAETLSRPPGLPDCDPAGPCGVQGVVAGAQTYDTPQALVSALAEGRLATAVAPAMTLLRQRCDVPKGQAAPAITALKVLYRQPLYLVVRAGPAAIAKPADWAKKTVVVGVSGSDSEALTLALLDAYRVPRNKVKLLRLAPSASVDAMRKGTANVGVFLGHVFDAAIGDLMTKGFTLMSLPDTPERTKLLHDLPVLEPSAIPPGTYPRLPAISTVAQPVVWVAGPSLDGALAGKLVTTMSEPHNQTRISSLVDPVPIVPEGLAFSRLPVPLSEGARRFATSEHMPVDVVNCPSETAR